MELMVFMVLNLVEHSPPVVAAGMFFWVEIRLGKRGRVGLENKMGGGERVCA